jgi:8-oxo-dGTP pyrophosphatase MutT (NUDIX family)
MGSPWVKGVCVLSVVLNFWFILFHGGKAHVEAGNCPVTFHGGGGKLPSSLEGCWCGVDDYCLCTPSLAIDTLILGPNDSILLVERADNGMHALPGGFVNWGERVEHAVVREVHEETNLVVRPEEMYLFGVYSDPEVTQ